MLGNLKYFVLFWQNTIYVFLQNTICISPKYSCFLSIYYICIFRKNAIFVFRQILYTCGDKMQYLILTKYYTRILILVIYILFVNIHSLYFDIRIYTTIFRYHKCIFSKYFWYMYFAKTINFCTCPEEFQKVLLWNLESLHNILHKVTRKLVLS